MGREGGLGPKGRRGVDAGLAAGGAGGRMGGHGGARRAWMGRPRGREQAGLPQGDHVLQAAENAGQGSEDQRLQRRDNARPGGARGRVGAHLGHEGR